jgi:hypothetical protein
MPRFGLVQFNEDSDRTLNWTMLNGFRQVRIFVAVWNHNNTGFTMSGILNPQTIFDMLDLLEILRRFW